MLSVIINISSSTILLYWMHFPTDLLQNKIVKPAELACYKLKMHLNLLHHIWLQQSKWLKHLHSCALFFCLLKNGISHSMICFTFASKVDIALQNNFRVVYEKDSEILQCWRLPLICIYPNIPSREIASWALVITSSTSSTKKPQNYLWLKGTNSSQ